MYESTVIFSPEIPNEQVDEMIEKIKKLVEKSEGNVTLTERTGRKRLAYPIKRFREGNYVYFELQGSGQAVSLLENFYKVNDSIIRYLTVKALKKKMAKKTKESEKKNAEEPVAKEEPETKQEPVEAQKTKSE
jgi:small subunit ribosomal protein S6